MGSSPSVPVYDPAQVAQEQGLYNEQTGVESQLMSEVGQVTPFGTLSYNQTGSYTDPLTGQTIPLETGTTQLSPTEQQLLNVGQGSQTEAALGANELLGGFNYGAANPLAVIGNQESGLMGGAESQFQSYEQPFFTQQNQQLESQLASQGLQPGDPAYDTALNNLRQSQGQQTSGFLSQMEPQAFSQAEQEYQLPLQTAESLYQIGAPASLNANLINTPTGSISPVNVAGIYQSAQQAQEANAQMQMMEYMGMLNGMGSLGSALLA